MDHHILTDLIIDLLIIMSTGFVIGVICKKISFSLIAGYFIVGVILGEGGLKIVSQHQHEIEILAEAGVLLLLFSVGIEFSFNELNRLSKYFIVGGPLQMFLVSVPLFFVCKSFGFSTNSSILASLAASLSSTVLVFKSLSEWGQSSTEHGKRGVSVLLFQDVALVPLMLFIPLLASDGQDVSLNVLGLLLIKSLVFVFSIVVIRKVVHKIVIPLLVKMRSIELLVLFSLSCLLGICLGTSFLDLPPVLGALATGIIFCSNQLSRQIDTIILPFREIFACIFFVSIGTLLKPDVFLTEPIVLTLGLLGMIALKTIAASIALKFTGLNWRSSFGMGLGLSQLGEFSFIIIGLGFASGAISSEYYNKMLFIALGSLILTPHLIKYGLKIIGQLPGEKIEESEDDGIQMKSAIVIGVGPVGRQAATKLETLGHEVCIIDVSPVNLHDFTTHGFHTIVGDARDVEVLERAKIKNTDVVITCVNSDEDSNQIIRSVRDINKKVSIISHCKYQSNEKLAKEAGANQVISEEKEAFNDLDQVFKEII